MKNELTFKNIIIGNVINILVILPVYIACISINNKIVNFIIGYLFGGLASKWVTSAIEVLNE